MLEDQKTQINTFKSMVEQNIEIHNNCHCCKEYENVDYENYCDKKLVEWLRNTGGLDEQSIKKASFYFFYLICDCWSFFFLQYCYKEI